MSRRYYDLPPLTALAAFEAAARHLSFKAAARELNVTPGAISHQVRGLEAGLNVALFRRLHRGVALTEEGERLSDVLRDAFRDIGGVLEALRERPAVRGVTVGSTTAMSLLWLTPAISRFWRTHAEVRVNQVVSDLLDFGMTRPALVVSYGPYEERDYHTAPLFRDTLVPVCAPAMARRFAPRDLEALASLPLIHLDAPDRRWTGWDLWFAQMGYRGRPRQGVKVNNYMIALQAAEDEGGMVLGWRRLIAPYLDSGRLVALEGFSLPAPTAFYLSRRADLAGAPEVAALADWIAGVSGDG